MEPGSRRRSPGARDRRRRRPDRDRQSRRLARGDVGQRNANRRRVAHGTHGVRQRTCARRPAHRGSPPRRRPSLRIGHGDGRRRRARDVEGHEFTPVSVGNPHAVVVGDPDDLPEIGPLLETHPRFPNRTNVQVAPDRRARRGDCAGVGARGGGDDGVGLERRRRRSGDARRGRRARALPRRGSPSRPAGGGRLRPASADRAGRATPVPPVAGSDLIRARLPERRVSGVSYTRTSGGGRG